MVVPGFQDAHIHPDGDWPVTSPDPLKEIEGRSLASLTAMRTANLSCPTSGS